MPKKHYPVQRVISLKQDEPVAANAKVDLSKVLSQINHRLYRESRTYECSVQIDANVADDTTVDVYALADTWYLKGALKLAKMAWDESNAEEIAMNGGKVARWNDFRVAALASFSDLKAVQFTQNNLIAASFNAGQFDLATVVDQAGQTRSFLSIQVLLPRMEYLNNMTINQGQVRTRKFPQRDLIPVCCLTWRQQRLRLFQNTAVNHRTMPLDMAAPFGSKWVLSTWLADVSD